MTETASPPAMGTPIMRQYQSLKAKNPDAVLFFRLGDFYELFDEDARRAAPLLELVLTQRQGIPMCGLPHHALAGYLGKLLRNGIRVAIAEQMEDPSQAKGMVLRDVVRVVTPGTVLEEELLSAKENNYLAAVAPGDIGSATKGVGLAWADLSTGELRYAVFPKEDSWIEEWGRIAPRETLWPEGTPVPAGVTAVEVPAKNFLGDIGRFSKSLFGGADLGLGDAAPAVSALLAYVERNQPAALATFKRPERYNSQEFMTLDEEAIRRLDLLPPAGPRSTAGSACLWDLLDRTVTAMGGRRLKSWLVRPLLNRDIILARQKEVDFFLNARRERRTFREILGGTGDLERIMSRVTAGTASGRDLSALRRTLRVVPSARESLMGAGVLHGDHPLGRLLEALHVPGALMDLLERALAEDPPMRLAEGGVIRDGYSAPLDELRAFASKGRGWISTLETEERQRTGIGSLKVGFTSVFGYYLEVSKANLGKVPPEWIRKQTLVNAERFVTPELKAQEDKILGADEKARALERELLADLRDRVLAHREALFALAEALGQADALAALAEAAERGRWVCPEIAGEDVLILEQSRHPVVEGALEARAGGAFVPNDLTLDMDGDRLLIVTGPNMGGKSTFLRQAAICAILAHMGSFVPAKRARVGLVDRIFTRIGAGDDLATGASTFLVEMREVAEILHHATPRSLVILDEVGRGTSTYDGLAVAWAVVEHLAGSNDRPGPKVLFATHYFELTELARRLPRVKNFHAAVREWARADGRHELVFLHQILPGPADRSYGVHVAQMAGLPSDVVVRAKDLLKTFEAGKRPQEKTEPARQPELFASHPALEALRAMDVNALTPLAALQALDDLKKQIRQ